MSARDELDRRLATWMTDAASDPPPAGRFERAMEATARRRPRPRWLAVLGSDWVGATGDRSIVPAWSGLSRELLTAALVALLLAVAIVGAALIGARLVNPDRNTWRLGALAYSVDGDVYVAAPDGGRPILVADGTEGAAYSHPHWSADGRYLMYREVGIDPGGVIHVTDSEGHPLGSFLGRQSTWAPDSSRIATWGRFLDEVDVRAPDGRLLATVAIPDVLRGLLEQRPGWLPDGSAIVLPGYYREGLEAWVLPVGGAAPRALSVEGRGYGLAFSPDGSRIAFDSKDGRLFLAAADGTGAQLLLADPGFWYWSPLWSPSGDRIAITYGRAPGGGAPASIQVVNVATKTAVTIHSSGGYLTAVDWSPDGQVVLVSQGPDGGAWSVPADGSGGHVVVERTDEEGADWRWVEEGSN